MKLNYKYNNIHRKITNLTKIETSIKLNFISILIFTNFVIVKRTFQNGINPSSKVRLVEKNVLEKANLTVKLKVLLEIKNKKLYFQDRFLRFFKF